MAKAILESISNEPTVYAAGIEPVAAISPFATEAMAEAGLEMSLKDCGSPSDFSGLFFDYLITVCEGTKEEYKNLLLQYQRKLHLGFSNPELVSEEKNEKLEAYRNLRDEMKTELHYFYYRILSKKTAT